MNTSSSSSSTTAAPTNNTTVNGSRSSGGSSVSSSDVSGTKSATSAPDFIRIIPDFYVSTVDGEPIFNRLLAQRVWSNSQTCTMMPRDATDERFKYDKMFLFALRRGDASHPLRHLPNGVPFEGCQFELAKIYRCIAETPLVHYIVRCAERQQRATSGKPIKFNHVAGTLLKDRNSKVTIAAGAACSKIAVAVFGARCLLSVDDDSCGRTVSPHSIIFIDPAVAQRKAVSLMLKRAGALCIVLVMRYVSRSYSRDELRWWIDIRKSAQNAKLLKQVNDGAADNNEAEKEGGKGAAAAAGTNDVAATAKDNTTDTTRVVIAGTNSVVANVVNAAAESDVDESDVGESDIDESDEIEESDVDESEIEYIDESDADESDADECDSDDVDESDADNVDESDIDESDEIDESEVDESEIEYIDESDADESDADECDSDECDSDDVDESDVDESDVDESDVDESDVDESDVDESDSVVVVGTDESKKRKRQEEMKMNKKR